MPPIETDSLKPGTHRLPCPVCDKGPRDDALVVTVFAERVVWVCHRCGDRGAKRRGDAGGFRPGVSPPRRERPAEPARGKLEKIQRLLQRCRPAKGTIAERYLRRRGIDLPGDTPLRFGAEVWHWPTQSRLPCLVAPIVGVRSNELQAAHLTFLNDDGTGKADVERARLYFGPKGGGCVKLSPDEDVTYGLAIGEGLETSFAAVGAGYRAWACLDAGNLAAFPVLDAIETLNVLVDHDAAGLRAAHAVRDRWLAAGREVNLICPTRAGEDWNDRTRGARHG